MLLVGPTLAILTGFTDSLRAYFQYLLALSMPFGREDATFSQGWSVFYWVVSFVTPPDTGSLVIETITAGGKVDAPMPQRVFHSP